MSIEYLNAAFQVRLMGATKAVLIALADRANRAGYCVASMGDVALRAGCSQRSAMRAVSELEALGLLVVVRDPGRSNRYLLMAEKLLTTSDTASPDLANLSTAGDTVSPSEVIHTGDTVSQTRDISAKTSDTTSHKPKNQNNHNARAREVGVVHSEPLADQAGRDSRRLDRPPLSGSVAPPSPKPSRTKAVGRGELTHVRAYLLESTTPQGGKP